MSIADALSELDPIRETVAPEGWSEQGRTIAAVRLKDDVLGDSAYPFQSARAPQWRTIRGLPVAS